VPGADAHRYGILTLRTGSHILDAIVEKPTRYDDDSAYINISRTLLPAAALGYFDKITPAHNGELQATDAIAAFAQDHDIHIHPVSGRYFDCGNTTGWLAANNAAAAAL
jgi:UTP--glucose-1-phosphate uridylyltransferase